MRASLCFKHTLERSLIGTYVPLEWSSNLSYLFPFCNHDFLPQPTTRKEKKGKIEKASL